MSFRSLVALIAGKPILNRKDLALRLGKSLRTIDRMKERHDLPKPVYLHGPHWRPEEIDAWEEQHKKQGGKS